MALPRPFRPPLPVEPAEPTRQILLLSNAIHTDIALPVDADLIERFGFLPDIGLPLDDSRVRFLVLGWGGREFYLETPTWDRLTPGNAVRAFLLEPSVMHAALAGAIGSGDAGVTALDLPPAGYAAMLDAIAATFERESERGAVLSVGQGYGRFDAFFAAKGRFNALLGCNTWTGAMLRAGGMQTGAWTPLPSLLRWSLRLHNSVPAGQDRELF